MAGGDLNFPIGQQVWLRGHFDVPVILPVARVSCSSLSWIDREGARGLSWTGQGARTLHRSIDEWAEAGRQVTAVMPLGGRC